MEPVRTDSAPLTPSRYLRSSSRNVKMHFQNEPAMVYVTLWGAGRGFDSSGSSWVTGTIVSPQGQLGAALSRHRAGGGKRREARTGARGAPHHPTARAAKDMASLLALTGG